MQLLPLERVKVASNSQLSMIGLSVLRVPQKFLCQQILTPGIGKQEPENKFQKCIACSTTTFVRGSTLV